MMLALARRPPPVIFAVAGLFFIGIFLCVLLANVWRGMKSGSSWARTTGRIKTFGFHYGVTEVQYDYGVNGELLTGGCITPGLLAGTAQGVHLPRSIYLNPDGSLKFAPGAEVPVFYDPKRTSDAALVTGVRAGVWRALAGLVLVCGLGWAGFDREDWLSRHVETAFGSLFVLGGIVILYIGFRGLRRYLRTRDFASTNGRLLNADVAYSSSGGEGVGGFAPVVQFEYEVEKVLYRSRQLTAIQAQVQDSRKKDAQLKIEQLRAQPEVTVYYDPRAPWDGFLRHGPLWGVIAPMAMGLVFGGVGVAMLLFRSSFR